jgi:serine/threonine protein kinase/tetratricopeptide (TPR) repeat protein
MRDRVGQHLGNYRLVSLLGQGGYAEVYLGQHVRFNQQAAIKVLHAHLSDVETEHFQQEAETIVTLAHPGIIRVLDFDVQDGVPFLVIDYAPNGSLRQRYPKGSLVPLPIILSSVKQVAEALQYAHEQKFIHRDVKPENMLVGRRQEVLLSDFGIATIVHNTSSLNLGAEGTSGTLSYMAPEQIEGHPRPASDQYALAVVVYEWLCGERPFEGSVSEVMAQHLSMSPLPLRERMPSIPPEVEQVVVRALAKDPKARFASVEEFASALAHASHEAVSVKPSPRSISGTQGDRKRPAPKSLSIHLLGTFQLISGNIPLTTVDWPRLQSLLAYLVLHASAPQSRTHLAFLLWPDSTETQAHTNLRTLLTRLRHALPNADTFLYTDRQGIQWRPHSPHAAWSLDVLDFEQALVHAENAQESCDARRSFEEAVVLYHGDLLPGCYDEWILPERDRLQQAFLKALERLIALQEEERDYDAAISTARRLLGHDPLHEATYRHLMRLYVSRGDPASALRVYYTCATILERELATEPSPATQEVYEHLMQQGTASTPMASAPTSLLATTPLVGRAHEWVQLEEAWQHALAWRPHFVLLLGEAGIGKTRLAEELLASVERQGLSTASARCYVAEGEASYAPVAEWLRAEPLRRPLSALAALWLTEVARVVPEILLERSDLPSPDPLTESWQYQRFREALARATLGARQPLLLLLDDLQWCDQETLAWLHYLLRFEPQARCLIIATMRPEEITADHPLESWLASMRRTGQVSEISLGPLDATNTALLADALTKGDLGQEARATLYQETEGNPLFIMETVRMGLLEGRGTNQRSTGKTPAASGASLPPTIQSVIAARLAQLSPLARELVSLASVIGRAFTWSVLAQASRLDEEMLVRGLDELWRKRIVREQGEDAYDFSHDKLRAVAYAGLSTARLRLLHRRVAETLEALYADALDQVSGQIASHLEQANRVEEAITYYRRAAEAARKLFANAETLALYKRAVLLLETACPAANQQWRRELLAQLHEGVGEVLTLTGHHSEARTAYQSSVALVPADAGIWQARLHRKIGQTLGVQEHYDQELQAYEQAEAALVGEQTGRSALWWQAWIDIQMSWIERSYYQSQIDELTERVELTRPKVQQYGLPPQRADFLRSLWLWSFWRDFCSGRERYPTSVECLGYAQALLAARLEMGNDREIGWARWCLGGARLWHGDLDEAEEQLYEALTLGERTGDVTLQARCLGNVIHVYRNRAQVEETRRAGLRALAFATEVGMPYYIGMAKANLAWIAWREGNLAEVRELGYAALALWSQSSIFIPVRWTALWPLIATELAETRIPEAIAYARQLLVPGQHLPPEALYAAVEAALAKWDTGQQDAASKELDQATVMAQQMGYM